MALDIIQSPVTLQVYIKSLDDTHFEGKATAVSFVDDKGPFDVLPEHENFIAIIKYNIVVHMATEKKSFLIDSGILKVSDNVVYVFLGIQKLG